MAPAAEQETPSPEDVEAWHRHFGVELFNTTWDLLDTADRTTDEDAEMLSAALASRHHWRQVGEPKNFAISDWQVSRVFAVTGAGRLAREFAVHSVMLCQDHDLGPYMLAYGHEAIARAALVDGDEATALEHIATARVLASEVEDEETRSLLEADLDELEA